MSKGPEDIDPPSAEPAPAHALVQTRNVQRIVVSPDDVFQADTREVKPVSLEEVVVRYMAVSGAIIGAVLLGALLWFVSLR